MRRRRVSLALVRQRARLAAVVGGAACALSSSRSPRCRVSAETLVTQLKSGLDAPVCLTWELTYACNLQCIHCLSSSGRRDPRELTTAEAKRVLDELQALQVFYINIGGGEPMVRRDFFEIVEYAIDHDVGVKFSTNGA